MTDLLIRNIAPQLTRELARRARKHRRSLSEEARILLKQALLQPSDQRKLGTAMMELFPQEHRGDDLIFEVPCDVSRPPDFE